MSVRCAVCHREELWDAQGRVVAVVVPGGMRRSADDPQWVRGRTAIASATGGLPPVVGVCEACGQWMVGEGPPIAVRVDTPEGPLEFDGGRIRGPAGLLDPSEAEAFLARQYRRPLTEGLGRDLRRASMLLWLLVPLAMWLFSILASGTFFYVLTQEPPAAVVGVKDW